MAVEAWHTAGAFDPNASLRHELVAAMPPGGESFVETIVRSLVDLHQKES